VHYGLTIFPTDYTMQPDELGRMAEERGFESVWFPEHTHIPVSRTSPWPGGPNLPKEYLHSYDPFVALMAAGAATRDLKLATGVCLIIERDPITTAKTIATLDRLSNGRFIFGIGGGWNKEEMENHGTNPKTRFRLLRERIQAMKVLWDEEEPSFHGAMVDFDPVWSYPKPVQRPNPPIVMGGDGETTFDRIVEFCDGWMPIARTTAERPIEQAIKDFEAKVPELKRRAEAAGRDPASISVSLFSAPPDADAIAGLERAGFDRVVFGLPCTDRDVVASKLDELAKLVK
jgi:probable F420-dependent oxidoreductase